MDFDKLLSEDVQTAGAEVKQFVDKFSQKFNLSEISGNWTRIWNATFQHLGNDEARHMQHGCVTTIRILSRDKTHLDEVITEPQVRILLGLANIDPEAIQTTKDESTVIESLKCLCNLVFNSSMCQSLFTKLNGADGIIKRVRTYKDESVKFDIQFFDMKLLFLITALNTSTRTRVRDELTGIVYLTELIDVIVQEKASELPVWFEDRDIDLICEILKVLFNLTSHSDSDNANENELQYCRLAGVLRHALARAKTTNREKRQEFQSNVINLITSLPNSCLPELVPRWIHIGQVAGPGGDDHLAVEFENHDVSVLDILLEFLRTRFETLSPTGSVTSERLSPILTVLIKCSRSHRILRRYIRSVILPPLTDVMQRPEEGTELRNHLCRLLTSANTQLRDLVAELLFVICKENVSRMAKHVGYGNSMGMFANKGLLGPDKVIASQDYSSDSGDSDTEEYRQMAHTINPIMGCFEPPHPNPFENMSDEQKEYEALKLVNLIDQLDRQGIIRPARIGADGKPEALEHVLQMQEDASPH